MSLDECIFAALLTVGHIGVFVVPFNVVHALGISEHRLERIEALFPIFFLGVSAYLAFALSQGGWSTWSWPLRSYVLLCLAIALVGLPLTTLLRVLRRMPERISERSSEIDLAEVHDRDSLIGTGRHSWLLRFPGNESLRLRRREWEVSLPTLPKEWAGLSLIHLSDLHFSHCYRRRFFELVVDEARSWDVDLVLFTGDLIDHDDTLDWIVPVLSRLRGRLGMFAILGNHDYNQDHQRIGRLVEEAGFTDLEGRWSRLERNGKTLALGGTSYPWGPQLDLGAQPDADFRLLLSHTPDLFYRASAAKIDLMLSGHNHGGQIRLPVIGPVLMPSLYSRRFDRGFFRSKQTLMYVSQGIGAKDPIRLGGCVPEINRFVLKSPRESAPFEAGRPSTIIRHTPDSLRLP